MAAYAALLSFKDIIEQLQNHPRPPISMDQNLVQSLIQYNVNFLQDFLEDYSHLRNEEVDRLQSRIADAAYEAEDVIESHIVDQILARSTTHGERISSTVDLGQGLQKVIQDMDLIKKEVMEIKEKEVQDEKHIRSSIPAATSFKTSSIGKNTMVDFGGVSEEIMDKLTQRKPKLQIIPIVGMGGIGKTTLAKNVYENPLIVQNFDIRAWTTISQEYQVNEMCLELLLCQENENEEELRRMNEQQLGEKLYQSLCGRRYFIILDDMWNIEAWYQLKRYFPLDNCGSGIIITSRLSNLGSLILGASASDSTIKMNFLNEHKSWDLFCNIVFGEDCCPLELEGIGKKIVENCQGLPLSIVVIGGLLAKSRQTQLYWEYIAENLNSIVNLEDNEQCLNLLYMSYNYLPVHLKPCFLYMGVFGEDDEIRVLELTKLWVAEGFLKPVSGKCLEEVAEEYLKALVDRNLVLVDKWKHNGEIKSCKMHDLLRDLCLREAKKDKFLYTKRIKSHNNFSHGITQRRVAIHQNTMEVEGKQDYDYSPEIHEALEYVPLARSLIQVSSKILPSPRFKLLRVLKAFGKKDRVEYAFQLVNLRYLCLFPNQFSWCCHKIPSSMYLFWNLQTLILRQSQTTGIVDIWMMPLLRHVELIFFKLSDPRQDGFVLEKIYTLSCVVNFQCTEDMIKRIPNIKKLKLFYHSNFAGSSRCLNNLDCLHKLENLTCKIEFKSRRRDLLQNLTFSYSLKKLALSGRGLFWEDMSTKIGSLPHLQVLKLKDDACIGPEWRTTQGQFCNLKFLKIDCCRMWERWITDSAHFPCLEHLILHSLWHLEEIPSDIGDIAALKLIEVQACSNSVAISAKKISEEQEELCNEDLQVRVEGVSQIRKSWRT